MNTKLFMGGLLALTLALTACGGDNKPAAQVKSNGLPAAGAKQEIGLVAYVEIDSLNTQYEYCKVEQEKLEAQHASFSQQIQQKTQALQSAAQKFQQKMQNGGITSEAQAKQEQQKLMNQEQQLQKFQQQAEQTMAKAMEDYQKKLREELNAFLAEYNKDGRYAYILSKSGDNMLYADKKLNITKEVVAGLNKRYEKQK